MGFLLDLGHTRLLEILAQQRCQAEVMTKGAEHAKTAHGIASIPPDMVKKVQAAIKDK